MGLIADQELKRQRKQLRRMEATEQRIKTRAELRKARKDNVSECKCRNHMGSSKNQYKSKERALDSILKYHLKPGSAYKIVKCPTSDKFHVATKRKR